MVNIVQKTLFVLPTELVTVLNKQKNYSPRYYRESLRLRARPRTDRDRISSPMSEGQCHLVCISPSSGGYLAWLA